MNVTARDRKVLMILIPIVFLAAYWFLILSPKRTEVTKADIAVTDSRNALDRANQQLAQLKAVKGSFSTQYAALVRLGKAVPSDLGMPSLLVQLDSAAHGTGIKFDQITVGARTAAPTAAPAAGAAPTTGSPATPASGQGTGGQAPAPPGGSAQNGAAAGGQPAQTGVGKIAEKAGNGVNTQNQSSAQSGQLDTTTSTSTRPGGGGLPIGGGASPVTGAPTDGSSGVPGLDSVALDLNFSGTYFALADFLHRMKRFVKVNNEHISVNGRLITIDGLALKVTGFGGKLTASMRTTVYLVPKAQGVTAGATPNGPAATPAATAGGGAQPVAPAASGSGSPPAAVATP